jgi:hypothetical protein
VVLSQSSTANWVFDPDTRFAIRVVDDPPSKQRNAKAAKARAREEGNGKILPRLLLVTALQLIFGCFVTNRVTRYRGPLSLCSIWPVQADDVFDSASLALT